MYEVECGAPIYSPTVWFAITPPPIIYSCNCFPGNSTTVTSNTTEIQTDNYDIEEE